MSSWWAPATTGGGTWRYALTGRSPASQARTVVAGPEELRVVPTGPAARDPLRHYACVVRRRSWTVVGNGDHVSLLATRLGAGGVTPGGAFADVDPEPDAPLFTPAWPPWSDPGRCGWPAACATPGAGCTAA